MIAKLFLLGAPRGEQDGHPVELPAKGLALLGYLALTGEPPPRDRLLGLLWAESADEAARKNLRNTLWSIRRALGDDAVTTSGDRLSLGPAVWADAREFARLAAQVRGEPEADAQVPQAVLTSTLAFYKGPFLDGLNLLDAPEFDVWLAAAQEHLAQGLVRLAGALIERHRAQGDWRAVIDVARPVLRHDSLHEPFHRVLMEAHARLGERAEAMRQYENARSALARDLGIDPLPETEALRAGIAAGQYDPPPAPAAAPSTALRIWASARNEPQFVGRTAERGALDEELAAASAGLARVVLLTGELGIGKSRLWREWSESAGVSRAALEARCLASSQALPFAPLVELFAAHPCTQPLYRANSPVAPAWLAEVARLLPAIRQHYPDLPAPVALPLDEERRRVFEAFIQVLGALNGQPLVVFVDDVHWADRTTLDWLAYLSHRLRERPLLLVLTYRPDEAPPALIHQVASWAREGVLRRIPLARLAPDEIARLVAALQANPASRHRLQAQSGGNPYFLIELSKSDSDEAASPALSDLIRSRLQRLSDVGRHVLQAAAVLEADFDLVVLRQTADRSETEALNALDELLTGGILLEAGPQLVFAHPLVAGLVRDDMSSARRMLLTRRAVEALAASHSDHLGPVAGRLADYHAALGEFETAASYADVAAHHALTLAAPTEAANFLRKAIVWRPLIDRRLELGQLLMQLGELPEARRAFQAVLTDAEVAGDRNGAARACLGLGETFLPAGRPDDTVGWAKRSLAFLDAEADPQSHALAHFLLGAGRLRAGGAALLEAESHLAEAARLAGEGGLSAIAARSRFELGNVFAERGDLPQAVDAYLESADLAAAHGDSNQQVLSRNNAAYHLMLVGDLLAAHEQIEAALSLAESYDLRLPRQYLYSTRGEIALAEGLWDDAEIWFKRSFAEAQSHDNLEHTAKGQANLAQVARGRGDLDSALILLEEAVAIAAPLTARYLQAQLDLWLAELYAARSERSAAEGALERAQARLSGGHYDRLGAQADSIRSRLARRDA